MHKIWKKAAAVILSGTMMLGLCTGALAGETDTVSGDVGTSGEEVTVDSGDKPYVALGEDLTADQRAAVLELLGITEEDLEDYTVVTVSNEQEHEYLDSYISSDKIGTRALSSVLVMEGKRGSGITVNTKNITYCTAGMYENALATAGLEDAEVIVAGPSPISGTAALIGAIEAYSTMTGDDIDEDIIDGAIHEIVITGQIEDSTGNTDEVEGMVAYLKEQLGDTQDMTDEELEQEIQDAADQFEVSLTQDEILQLKELLRKLQGLDLNWDQLAKQAQGIYDKLKDMGFDLSSIDTGEFASRVSGFFGKIADFYRNLFNIE